VRRLALVLVLLAGCSVEATVLEDPAGVILGCDQAWTTGVPGAPCSLDGPCDRQTPSDPMCCTDFAYCTEAGLVIDTACDPTCSCQDDRACEYGARICENGVCEACPPPDVCPPCPEGWARLLRNGCESCQCAPPSQCELPGELCPDQASVCYAGASCAEMCDAYTPGCCDNTCAAPGCEGPAPVGCYTDCPVELGCPSICATSACTCDGARWSCDAVCVDDLTISCVYP
jgi:hypothetical protein